MRACIRRGSKQIGGSCIEVEQDGKRLLIDLGLPLDAPANTADIMPDGLVPGWLVLIMGVVVRSADSG